MAEQDAQQQTESDEDAQYRRVKNERLRDLEKGREKQAEERERIRRAQEDGTDPYANLRARAYVTPDAAKLSPEELAARERAEREAGVDDVEVGPQPAEEVGRATRRFPVAVLALVPVLGLFALPAMLGKPSGLRAPDGRGGYGTDGRLYVTADAGGGTLRAPVRWNAPPLAFLRVSGAAREASDVAVVSFPDAGEEAVAQRVTVSGFTGEPVSAEVVPVPLRSGASLLVGGASPGGHEGEYVLYVGPHGARLALTNDDTSDAAQALPVFVLSLPDAKNFTLALPEENGKPASRIVAKPGEPVVLPVTSAEGGVLEDRLVLMTGDTRHPIITVLLRRSDKDAGDQAMDTLLSGDANGALALASAQTRDPAALAVRAYVLKSQQKPGMPEKEMQAANRALAGAVQALGENPDVSDRVRALVRRAMALEAVRQNKPDKAAQYRAEADALSPEVARLP